jgi:hypothetical protein
MLTYVCSYVQVDGTTALRISDFQVPDSTGRLGGDLDVGYPCANTWYICVSLSVSVSVSVSVLCVYIHTCMYICVCVCVCVCVSRIQVLWTADWGQSVTYTHIRRL